MMAAVNERERLLLEKIAAEGKAVKIARDDLRLAKVLEGDVLLFIVYCRRRERDHHPRGEAPTRRAGKEAEARHATLSVHLASAVP